jgi:precorrin-2 dehydrogenase/sirohydrochlorin ferrochelatase
MSGQRYLPLVIDLKDRKIVIFGGGSVAERKAKLFSEYATTIVISRNFSECLLEMTKRGEVITNKRDINLENIDELINDAFIVIPATDDETLNDQIAERAKFLHKLVNMTDGDVIVPSIIRRDDIIIGVSTLGKSPAMSRYVREKIESEIQAEEAEMVKLQEKIRKSLKDRITNQKRRERIIWDILRDEEIWESLRRSKEEAYELALDRVKDV